MLRDTGPVTNETFHITQNGTDVVSLTISTGETVKRLVSSVDFDQDDVVGCRLDAGSTEKITTVHARFRRRV